MIKVVKGDQVRFITKGTYESMYRRSGWKLYNEVEKDEKKFVEEVSLSEIPMNEMTSEQLVEYALSLGIEVDDGITKKNLKRLIIDHLNS